MTDKTVQEFKVTGMTCGHCVSAVTEEISALDGVSEVSVALVPSGTSTVEVTADRALTPEEVSAALDEAGGYALAPARSLI
ncbi:MAG TPA: heavy metal-associated domain-containing protein [Dermatophilaceae bacterium]|jgi:copper chaperone CopZ|nr:heavy metal-associated domain-containing protein [Dermatophilaceae bacterium]